MERQAIDVIDITHVDREFIDALAESQLMLDCAACGGDGCPGCGNRGFHYVLVQT